MSNQKLRRLPLAAAALAVCTGANAGYSSPDGNFYLSGFGTVAYTRSSTDEAYFNYRGQGSGADTKGDFGTDSRAALQGTYKFTPTLQGTAQVISKLTPYGDYTPAVEWAFAKWQATPAISVRAGKLGGPFFMLSDFREVNYAITSVHPSMEVYGQVPITNYDAVDATYQFNAGPATISSSFAMGRSVSKYALDFPSNRDPSDIRLTGMKAFNILAEFDNGLSLRFGRTQGKLAIYSSGSAAIAAGAAKLAAGLSATGQPEATSFAAVANALSSTAQDASFTGFGFSYDEGSWVASGEYTVRKTKTYVSDTTGITALVGYRFGKFTPYVSAGKVKTDERHASLISSATAASTITKLGGSATVQAQVGGVAYGSRFVMDTQNIDQRTTSIGVRWDARSNLAVKAQFDQISKPADGTGLFLVPGDITSGLPKEQAWVVPSKKVNVVTLSLDFVF